MTTYRERLAVQLRVAAERLGASGTTPVRAVPPRTRKRRWLVGGLVAAGLATPAALAGPAIFGGDTDSGAFPDGSSFQVWTGPDAEYGSCEHLELRGPAGESGGISRSCPQPAGNSRSRNALTTGWVATPGDTVLLRGTVPDGTASVEVPHALGAVRFDRSRMRFAAMIKRSTYMVVIARAADGEQLDRFEQPPLEPAPGGAGRPEKTLAAGFPFVNQAGTVTLRGTAPDGTASVEVRDAIGAVEFDQAQLFFTATIPQEAHMVVIARAANGEQLDRVEAPSRGMYFGRDSVPSHPGE